MSPPTSQAPPVNRRAALLAARSHQEGKLRIDRERRPRPATPASTRPPIWASLVAIARLRALETSYLLAHHNIERRPRRTRAQRSEEVAQRSLPVRELVTGITAVLCHHRQDEAPAILKQRLIDIRIMLADRCWPVGEVELDRSTAARLQVNE